MAQRLDSNGGKASVDTFCLPQERYHCEPLPPGSFLAKIDHGHPKHKIPWVARWSGPVPQAPKTM